MLDALADIHEVATLTEVRWTPEVVDRFYGTQLARANITQFHLRGLARLLPHVPGGLERLRMATIFREARELAGGFDLLVTADNYGAFARPGLQYMHYPLPLRPKPDRLQALTPLIETYYGICDRISGLSWEVARANRTLANSRWTARLLRDSSISADVLYPPVVDPGTGLPWLHREPRFLTVGRFHGSKRLETVIAILDAVRIEAPQVTLTLVGSDVDAEYARRIRHLTATRPWVTMLEDVTQEQLFTLMQRSRYGLHAMENEHFGMAPAEMARAGCVVFGHDSGGLVEVLDECTEVLWRTPEDAVARIARVLRDDALGHALSARLAEHAAKFSVERFSEQLRRYCADIWRNAAF